MGAANDEPMDLTYRVASGVWQVLCSSGEHVTTAVRSDGPLDQVRAAARTHLAVRLGLTAEQVEQRIRHEYAQPPEIGSTTWHGLRWTRHPPDFGVDDPNDEDQQQLAHCYQYYRDRVPDGMRVELYGNRVRIEPGPFGRRAAIIDAVGGHLAEQTPDELNLALGPHTRDLDQAREQLHRAKLIPVPDGFVRVVT